MWFRQEVQALPRSAGPRSLKTIEIVAGVLRDATGRVLIAQRPEGKELAGRWEFPGGKLQGDETPCECLTRELREELGVEVRSGERLLRYSHRYPDKLVWLDMWLVTSWAGEARGLDAQALRWVDVQALPQQDMLEADRPVVDRLVAMFPSDRGQ